MNESLSSPRQRTAYQLSRSPACGKSSTATVVNNSHSTASIPGGGVGSMAWTAHSLSFGPIELLGDGLVKERAIDRKGETRQGFLQLGAFFREETPLKVLDQLSREKPNLDELTELASKLLDEVGRYLVRLIGETMRSGRFVEHRDKFADFLIGVIAAKYENQELDICSIW